MKQTVSGLGRHLVFDKHFQGVDKPHNGHNTRDKQKIMRGYPAFHTHFRDIDAAYDDNNTRDRQHKIAPDRIQPV
jgi:hypothetical protein